MTAHATVFPFSAIAGQATAKLALILGVINPRVGGILLRGEKGTAKSTVVRSLAALLPEIEVVAGCPFSCDPGDAAACCPRCAEALARGETLRTARRPVRVVDLPLSAGLDRVAGSLHLERAVKDGRWELDPGLLAAANRGILYVDEINLLDAHLVNAVLDAAASGANVVEREGIAVRHPARFVLVGTMNPEEGEPRPQLLDRFGLAVEVRGETDVGVRAEIMRRREAFDADPRAFVRAWAPAEAAVRRRLVEARARLPAVRAAEPVLALIVDLCKRAGAAGHRGDIVILEGARALAAWQGHDVVSPQDVETVARLALLHRATNEGSGETHAEELRDGTRPDVAGTGRHSPAAPKVGGADEAEQQGATRPGERSVGPRQGGGRTKPGERVISPSDDAFAARLPEVDRPRPVRRPGPAAWNGRRFRVRRPGGRGRYLQARNVAAGGDLALDATIRAAAPHQRWRRRDGVAIAVEPSDVRGKVRERRTGALLLFVVDGSGSMAGRERMAEAKAAVISLLADAYRQRDRVGLISFRGQGAEVLLPPTNSVELAQKRLRQVPTGGKTPLAAGLAKAGEVAVAHLRRHPDTPVLAILLTDGRANVGLGGDPFEDAERVAVALREAGIDFLIVDAEKRGIYATGENERLARALGASYAKIEDLRADRLVEAVRRERRWQR